MSTVECAEDEGPNPGAPGSLRGQDGEEGLVRGPSGCAGGQAPHQHRPDLPPTLCWCHSFRHHVPLCPSHSAARARCPGPPTFPSSLRRGPSRPHASSLRLSPGLAESSASACSSGTAGPPSALQGQPWPPGPQAGGSHLSLSEHTLLRLAERTELGTGREPRVLASRAWKQMGDRRVASRGRAVGAEGTFYERPRGQRGRRGRGGRQGLAAGLVDVRLEGRWGRQVGATGLISPGVLAVLHKCPRRGPF